MGFMNIAALKHDQIDPAQHLDVPDELYRQSHHSSCNSLPLSRLSQSTIEEALGHADHRFRRNECVGEHGLYACNPWHTSGNGTLILTSDYIINLFFYQPFGTFPLPKDDPDAAAALASLQGEALVTKMAADYRKLMIKARSSARNHGHGDMVSQRKLLSIDPDAEAALPEAVTPDSDLTGYVWANYDVLHEDKRPEDQQLTGEQWQALIREGRDNPPGFGRYLENRIMDYRSLGGFTTLGQQDIIVAQYTHLNVWHSARLTRARRTPPEALVPDHLRYNEPLGTILSSEYPLMREFFASQGVRIQL